MNNKKKNLNLFKSTAHFYLFSLYFIFSPIKSQWFLPPQKTKTNAKFIMAHRFVCKKTYSNSFHFYTFFLRLFSFCVLRRCLTLFSSRPTRFRLASLTNILTWFVARDYTCTTASRNTAKTWATLTSNSRPKSWTWRPPTSSSWWTWIRTNSWASLSSTPNSSNTSEIISGIVVLSQNEEYSKKTKTNKVRHWLLLRLNAALYNRVFIDVISTPSSRYILPLLY